MVAFGEWSFGEWSPPKIGRSEIGRSENGRSENGRCTGVCVKEIRLKKKIKEHTPLVNYFRWSGERGMKGREGKGGDW
jgi:hypothetical protein